MPVADKNIILRLALALCLLSAQTPCRAFAAGSETGVYSAPFLSMPLSAAHLGRGAISTSGAMDASDISRFTANSALADGTQFIYTQAGPQERYISHYAAAVLPVIYSGAFGAFWRMDERDASANSGVFGFSFARYFPDYRLGGGVHLSFAERDVYGKDESFAAAGADFRVDPLDILSARAYFLNAGAPVSDGCKFFRQRLAGQYGAIVNYHPLSGVSNVFGIDIGIGAQKTEREPLLAGISAEAAFFERFFLRAGYENSTKEKLNIDGLSAGMGFMAGYFGMDGAYRFASDGGGTWAASVKLHIEEMKRRTFDDGFAIARKYYAKKRFKKSYRYSSEALELDPRNWNAAALRNLSDAELRRENWQEFAIIYGGNPKGRVIPYPPSRDALGGLGRYAAAVKSLRRSYPAHLSIDAGNLLNTASAEHRVRLAAEYYNLMSFDAIAPGEGELFLGLPEFSDLQRRALPIVSSNVKIPEDAGIYSGILLSRGGFKLYLLNIIGESMWVNNGIDYDFNANMDRLRNILANRAAASAMLRAAVVHGDIKDIEKIAAALPSLNIIIAGSLEEKFDSPRRAGSALIFSAGTENKFVGCVSLKFDGKKSAAYNGNKLYPVHQDIAPDSLVEDIVKLISAKVDVDNGPDGYAAAPLRGVIPFLSDRNGKASAAFLKTIDISREYTLASEVDNCRKPLISTLGNRAAFIYGKPEEMNGRLHMVDLETMKGRTVSSGKNVVDAAFSEPDDFLYYIEADSGSDTGAIYKTRTFMYGSVTVLEQDSCPRRGLAVSSDGASLLFCSNRDGNWHIYAVDSSAASPPVKLTTEKANHSRPRFSPDGKHIAYLSDLNGFDGRTELWVFERKTWEHRKITVRANVRDFCWKDDSRTIYFSSGVNVTDINSIDVLDKQAECKKMTPSGFPKNWSETAPLFIRYKGVPKIVYTREYIDGKRQLYWFNAWNGRDQKIFTFGEWNEWME